MSASTAHDIFSAEWLALREELDARSRSHRLTGLAADWLNQHPTPHGIVDLGSGSGSNLGFLAPRLPGPQRWRLVDHDARLLAHARRRGALLRDGAGARIELETHCRSLSPLDRAFLADADLVVASALFDLMSRSWVESLVAACAGHGQALLLTLSVDGDWAFLDRQGARVVESEDIAVRTLFQTHQHRDKGLGPALGGEAPAVLASTLLAAGFRIESDATPWHLAAGDAAQRGLAEALVTGWHDAAIEQTPTQAARLGAWRDRRLADIEAGELGVTVGHRDLFAWPAARG
ncbi:MAG: class I SAM-dependent methyltransferase [Pseudomonadota bacterium]